MSARLQMEQYLNYILMITNELLQPYVLAKYVIRIYIEPSEWK